MSMDYTEANFLFKLKKAARYIRLYGISRTLAKIRAQYHMKAVASFEGSRWINPNCRNPDSPERNVAMIGCGNYAFSTIAYYINKCNRGLLRCVFDIQKSRAMSLCKAHGGAFAVTDWQEIVADPQVKIVFIASNHASHAEYAVACIGAGKCVHIEKPHVVSQEQLDWLTIALAHNSKSKVFLGFNRPRSVLFRQLQELLAKESGPVMINWFVAGHEIPDGHWYFDEKEGGRVLGNLCHWTDLALHLVTMEKAFPCTIVPSAPIGAKSDFVSSVIFADQSCATFTFSAKGHTFEGVREVLNIHKGNVLANLTDFQRLTVEVVDRKIVTRLRHRDHGHEANIVHSLAGANEDGVPGEDMAYIIATAKFFLAVRQAIDSGEKVVVSREDIGGVVPRLIKL
ncbi:LmbZ [Candidatus Methylomirabilis lanthanidiphila]|uniref:LmbZ n=1 Tax=Candidatus Methylomirabilis lanthanidiphila TaxID=2211376 RepID=A0A564ZJQ3_9BACT|nr:Gfo/Idh/MocA family oxidoreductase [Candidatus Methylomirabilis lanthanidiphila]VUZ84778.1 LmbZ [Candidatus Methylomirabilis lanthanidiphila]